MKVRPYNDRAGKWKDGGAKKHDEDSPKSQQADKPVKPSAKYKWYLGKDGLVHIVSVGRFNKVTQIMSFAEAEATREQEAMLRAATEDQELAK
jgi:hypothetical protein